MVRKQERSILFCLITYSALSSQISTNVPVTTFAWTMPTARILMVPIRVLVDWDLLETASRVVPVRAKYRNADSPILRQLDQSTLMVIKYCVERTTVWQLLAQSNSCGNKDVQFHGPLSEQKPDGKQRTFQELTMLFVHVTFSFRVLF